VAADQIPLGEIEQAIQQFNGGTLSFRGLIARLEACLDNLSDEDPPWKAALQREWGRLEDAYAYASFHGRKTIPERDVPAVEFALKEVRRLIAEKRTKPM